MPDVSICLNMIVKNESRIITRLLKSVLPIIDTYVICDTGSTDGTSNIITAFFDTNNIKGEIIYEPFKNFGYNRTFALHAAKGKATYALLLDADMIFNIEPAFNKNELTIDAYMIIQKGGSLSYHNMRLIRLNIDAKCVCPTHEYYDLPPGTSTAKLDTIWINDIGDGGCKVDKFERDIRLLKQGIEEEVNGKTNGRYYFYLANSYFNMGKHEESISYYKRRIEIGGWNEEVFYAHLNLGHAYKTIGQDEMAICTWMNGYNMHPQRSETIYEITKYYREKGKTKIGMAFCLLGKNIPYPKNDSLFIHTDVYDTGFDYELSILGYYNNYPKLNKVLCSLMNRLPDKFDNLLSNYKFCYPNLSQYQIYKTGGIEMKDIIDVCGTKYELYGSNPCIFRIGNKYMCNVRFVNYILNNDGSYFFSNNDGKIITVNKIYELDENLNFTKNKPYTIIPGNNSLRYIGIEDLKLYYYNTTSNATFNATSNVNTTKLSFMGTIQSPRTYNISIGYGEINLNADVNVDANADVNTDALRLLDLNYSVVETQWNKGCEKNWVFFDENYVIYEWFPLTIGKIVKRNCYTNTNANANANANIELFLEVQSRKQMPNFFRKIRGSSHGYEFENEVWFLCHIVEYCEPRQYYHVFVVFNKTQNINDKIKLLKWSNLFKFEGEIIEYTLGLIVEQNRIIIAYSKWDKHPTICIFDKFKIEMEMFD